MRVWAFLLGGLIVWTVHFFVLYGIGSIFLTTTVARVLTIIVTFLCLAAIAFLLVRSRRRGKREQDEVSRWTAILATFINAIAAVAIVWQGLPAFLSGG